LAVVKNDTKKFARLFVLQCILISLMFAVFSVGYLGRPANDLIFYFFISSFLLWYLAYSYMTYYLGKNQHIEYSFGIHKDFVNIPLAFFRRTERSGRRFVFYSYVLLFALLVLTGIVMTVGKSGRAQ
jgi:cytochrome b subunit of formate dehydrogenase